MGMKCFSVYCTLKKGSCEIVVDRSERESIQIAINPERCFRCPIFLQIFKYKHPIDRPKPLRPIPPPKRNHSPHPDIGPPPYFKMNDHLMNQ